MSYASMFAGLAQTFMSLDDESVNRAREEAQAKENQQLAELAAADAERRGQREAALSRMAGGKLAGKQRVAFANSGVAGDVGTPASVQAESRMFSEMDAKTIENNAALEAWGFRTHGLRYREASAYESERSRRKDAATLLGGLGRAAADYGRIKSE